MRGYLLSVLVVFMALSTQVSCKKSSSPSTPAPAPTDTPTPPNTSTPTNTGTRTFTPTATNTSTRTFTPTFTSTSTVTYTPTITFTPTWTLTFTNTPTITSTPTPTLTPTVTCTATVYTFTTEGFEGGTTVPANWTKTLFNSGTSSPLDISTSLAYAGSNSLHLAVTYVGNNGGAEISYPFNPPSPANLQNKTVSFYYYIDQLPTATGSHYEFWINSINGSYPITNGTPVVGSWQHVTQAVNSGAANPSGVSAVDFTLYAGTTGPFNVVNIYIDEFSIQ